MFTGASPVVRTVTDLVIELNSLDHLFIGIEQGSNKVFLLNELDVSDDCPSSRFGLVEILLYLGTLLHRLVFSVDVLQASKPIINSTSSSTLTLHELTRLLAH